MYCLWCPGCVVQQKGHCEVFICIVCGVLAVLSISRDTVRSSYVLFVVSWLCCPSEGTLWGLHMYCLWCPGCVVHQKGHCEVFIFIVCGVLAVLSISRDTVRSSYVLFVVSWLCCPSEGTQWGLHMYCLWCPGCVVHQKGHCEVFICIVCGVLAVLSIRRDTVRSSYVLFVVSWLCCPAAGTLWGLHMYCLWCPGCVVHQKGHCEVFICIVCGVLAVLSISRDTVRSSCVLFVVSWLCCQSEGTLWGLHIYCLWCPGCVVHQKGHCEVFICIVCGVLAVLSIRRDTVRSSYVLFVVSWLCCPSEGTLWGLHMYCLWCPGCVVHQKGHCEVFICIVCGVLAVLSISRDTVRSSYVLFVVSWLCCPAAGTLWGLHMYCLWCPGCVVQQQGHCEVFICIVCGVLAVLSSSRDTVRSSYVLFVVSWLCCPAAGTLWGLHIYCLWCPGCVVHQKGHCEVFICIVCGVLAVLSIRRDTVRSSYVLFVVSWLCCPAAGTLWGLHMYCLWCPGCVVHQKGHCEVFICIVCGVLAVLSIRRDTVRSSYVLFVVSWLCCPSEGTLWGLHMYCLWCPGCVVHQKGHCEVFICIVCGVLAVLSIRRDTVRSSYVLFVVSWLCCPSEGTLWGLHMYCLWCPGCVVHQKGHSEVFICIVCGVLAVLSIRRDTVRSSYVLFVVSWLCCPSEGTLWGLHMYCLWCPGCVVHQKGHCEVFICIVCGVLAVLSIRRDTVRSSYVLFVVSWLCCPSEGTQWGLHVYCLWCPGCVVHQKGHSEVFMCIVCGVLAVLSISRNTVRSSYVLFVVSWLCCPSEGTLWGLHMYCLWCPGCVVHQKGHCEVFICIVCGVLAVLSISRDTVRSSYVLFVVSWLCCPSEGTLWRLHMYCLWCPGCVVHQKGHCEVFICIVCGVLAVLSISRDTVRSSYLLFVVSWLCCPSEGTLWGLHMYCLWCPGCVVHQQGHCEVFICIVCGVLAVLSIRRDTVRSSYLLFVVSWLCCPSAGTLWGLHMYCLWCPGCVVHQKGHCEVFICIVCGVLAVLSIRRDTVRSSYLLFVVSWLCCPSAGTLWGLHMYCLWCPGCVVHQQGHCEVFICIVCGVLAVLSIRRDTVRSSYVLFVVSWLCCPSEGTLWGLHMYCLWCPGCVVHQKGHCEVFICIVCGVLAVLSIRRDTVRSSCVLFVVSWLCCPSEGTLWGLHMYCLWCPGCVVHQQEHCEVFICIVCGVLAVLSIRRDTVRSSYVLFVVSWLCCPSEGTLWGLHMYCLWCPGCVVHQQGHCEVFICIVCGVLAVLSIRRDTVTSSYVLFVVSWLCCPSEGTLWGLHMYCLWCPGCVVHQQGHCEVFIFIVCGVLAVLSIRRDTVRSSYVLFVVSWLCCPSAGTLWGLHMYCLWCPGCVVHQKGHCEVFIFIVCGVLAVLSISRDTVRSSYVLFVVSWLCCPSEGTLWGLHMYCLWCPGCVVHQKGHCEVFIFIVCGVLAVLSISRDTVRSSYVLFVVSWLCCPSAGTLWGLHMYCLWCPGCVVHQKGHCEVFICIVCGVLAVLSIRRDTVRSSYVLFVVSWLCCPSEGTLWGLHIYCLWCPSCVVHQKGHCDVFIFIVCGVLAVLSSSRDTVRSSYVLFVVSWLCCPSAGTLWGLHVYCLWCPGCVVHQKGHSEVFICIVCGVLAVLSSRRDTVRSSYVLFVVSWLCCPSEGTQWGLHMYCLWCPGCVVHQKGHSEVFICIVCGVLAVLSIRRDTVRSSYVLFVVSWLCCPSEGTLWGLHMYCLWCPGCVVHQKGHSEVFIFIVCGVLAVLSSSRDTVRSSYVLFVVSWLCCPSAGTLWGLHMYCLWCPGCVVHQQGHCEVFICIVCGVLAVLSIRRDTVRSSYVLFVVSWLCCPSEGTLWGLHIYCLWCPGCVVHQKGHCEVFICIVCGVLAVLSIRRDTVRSSYVLFVVSWLCCPSEGTLWGLHMYCLWCPGCVVHQKGHCEVFICIVCCVLVVLSIRRDTVRSSYVLFVVSWLCCPSEGTLWGLHIYCLWCPGCVVHQKGHCEVFICIVCGVLAVLSIRRDTVRSSYLLFVVSWLCCPSGGTLWSLHIYCLWCPGCVVHQKGHCEVFIFIVCGVLAVLSIRRDTVRSSYLLFVVSWLCCPSEGTLWGLHIYCLWCRQRQNTTWSWRPPRQPLRRGKWRCFPRRLRATTLRRRLMKTTCLGTLRNQHHINRWVDSRCVCDITSTCVWKLLLWPHGNK